MDMEPLLTNILKERLATHTALHIAPCNHETRSCSKLKYTLTYAVLHLPLSNMHCKNEQRQKYDNADSLRFKYICGSLLLTVQLKDT